MPAIIKMEYQLVSFWIQGGTLKFTFAGLLLGINQCGGMVFQNKIYCMKNESWKFLTNWISNSNMAPICD